MVEYHDKNVWKVYQKKDLTDRYFSPHCGRCHYMREAKFFPVIFADVNKTTEFFSCVYNIIYTYVLVILIFRMYTYMYNEYKNYNISLNI